MPIRKVVLLLIISFLLVTQLVYSNSNNGTTGNEGKLRKWSGNRLMLAKDPPRMTKELLQQLGQTNELVLHRLRSHRRMRKNKRRRRTSRHSISSAIVETANCEHVELIDCGDFGDKGMRCMVTATGMPCCICNGRLRLRKKRRHH